MRTFERISEIKEYLAFQKAKGRSIGFAPTMGFLHEGHCSLIQKSASENDITVVSVFVNPTQFAPNEDFEKYPRDIQSDLHLSEQAGAQIMFTPSVEEMYPDGYATYVDVMRLTQGLCGKSRPQHFRGVTTVVCKLFNIITPTRAYFGQKDAQQLVVLSKMVRDLDMDVTIVPCPIVREPDGLAKSSRNVYLLPDERSRATALYRSLCRAVEMVDLGERNAATLKTVIGEVLAGASPSLIDYIEIVSADSLEPATLLAGKILIALAVKFGNTRLIDNIMIEI